jgi:hypothetical protein
LFEARQDQMSREVAEFLNSICFDQRDIERVNELSELAREGKLSRAEEAELDNYIRADNLLAILQSKARLALKRLNGIR